MDVEHTGARSRRLVAVALTEHESAGAGTSLAEIVGSAGETDLLVVRRDPAGRRRLVDPADAEDYADSDTDTDTDSDSDTDAGPGTGPGVHAVLGARARPGATSAPPTPAGRIRLHRLGLRWTVQDGDEGDLVAALSELVGFDPDDDTYCVAPARTGPVADPEIEVVRRAVRRVARVYGLPVLPYRPLAAGPAGATGAATTAVDPSRR